MNRHPNLNARLFVKNQDVTGNAQNLNAQNLNVSLSVKTRIANPRLLAVVVMELL
jgi:hypothetical protein